MVRRSANCPDPAKPFKEVCAMSKLPSGGPSANSVTSSPASHNPELDAFRRDPALEEWLDEFRNLEAEIDADWVREMELRDAEKSLADQERATVQTARALRDARTEHGI